MDIIVEKSYKHAKPIIDAWVKKNPWLINDGKRDKTPSLATMPAAATLPAALPVATLPATPTTERTLTEITPGAATKKLFVPVVTSSALAAE